MSEAIWRWSATRVAAAIRGREISAREATDAALSRMAAVNGKLNAVTVDLSDAARAVADRADRAVAAGAPLGALPGGRELEEGRRDHHRPDQYAGLQLPHRHRQRLARSHLQSVVAEAHAGRL